MSRKNRKQSAPSLTETSTLRDREPCVNVGTAEREISMVGGTILAVCGLLRGSTSGLALAAIGAALIYRSHTGHCHVYEALGHTTVERDRRGDARIPEDGQKTAHQPSLEHVGDQH